MPRMRILSTVEQELFETPPVFNSIQRKQFFVFSDVLLEAAASMRKSTNRIGFLLSSGYFKVTKRFFAPKDYHLRDIEYVARRLELTGEAFEPDDDAEATRLRHQHLILEYYGYRRFDGPAEDFVIQEIEGMVRAQLKPRLIFWRCIDLMIRERIQVPNYHRLSNLILTALNQRKRDLAKLIENELLPETRDLLESLFVQDCLEDGNTTPSQNARYRLTLLKKLSQSTKPTKIKERVADQVFLKQLYEGLESILPVLNLGHEGIRYYANSVIKSDIFQLKQRSDEDRYVHVVAFIANQFYQLQDNLVDVLLSVIQSDQNSAQREHKDWCYIGRKARDQTLFSLLSRLDEDIFGVLKNIRDLTEDASLSDADKVVRIRALLTAQDDNTPRAEDQLASLRRGLEEELGVDHYYEVLEDRSIRLQNRVSPIIKTLSFQAEPGASVLMEAIQHFKSQDGAVTRNAPLDFLEPDERKTVAGDGKKFRTSLYKTFLFIYIASAVKSGNLNLEHSYKYRPLDDYLISKARWQDEKEKLLEQAGLQAFANPEIVLTELDKALHQQYLTTNKNIQTEANPHLKIAPNGDFRVSTPKQDEKDSEPLQHFFPERHYVPLTEVLSTVNRHSKFLEELQHWQQRYNRGRLPEKMLYAGIMALGCAIGTRKMARISNQINEGELEHTVNWYLSLDNIQAANDRVVRMMDKMDLPNLQRRSQDKLHTASDGQ